MLFQGSLNLLGRNVRLRFRGDHNPAKMRPAWLWAIHRGYRAGIAGGDEHKPWLYEEAIATADPANPEQQPRSHRDQAASETATPASVVCSFGVLLFQMLTDRPPLESDEPLELLRLHRNTPAPA